MKYAEAFKKLGYRLDNHQTDWSAENEAGVCVSLWRDKISWSPAPPSFDEANAWLSEDPGADKPGFSKRTRHLKNACDNFDGFIDVVLRGGRYRDTPGDAEPWNAELRGGRWKITRLDRADGTFRAEVVVQKEKGR